MIFDLLAVRYLNRTIKDVLSGLSPLDPEGFLASDGKSIREFYLYPSLIFYYLIQGAWYPLTGEKKRCAAQACFIGFLLCTAFDVHQKPAVTQELLRLFNDRLRQLWPDEEARSAALVETIESLDRYNKFRYSAPSAETAAFFAKSLSLYERYAPLALMIHPCSDRYGNKGFRDLMQSINRGFAVFSIRNMFKRYHEDMSSNALSVLTWHVSPHPGTGAAGKSEAYAMLLSSPFAADLIAFARELTEKSAATFERLHVRHMRLVVEKTCAELDSIWEKLKRNCTRGKNNERQFALDALPEDYLQLL